MWIVGVWRINVVVWFVVVWLVGFQAWSELFWVLMVILYWVINVLNAFWNEDVLQFDLDACVDLELEAVWRVSLDRSQDRDADLVRDDSDFLADGDSWRTTNPE